jgi:adenylate kinase
MSSSPVDKTQTLENKKLDDLEVKDAQFIFNSVWMALQDELGEKNLRFPKEIFWLNGAPGAGKGTNTGFIMKFRDLTAPPIIISDLLKSPSARKKIDAGMLVGDREVIQIILRKLLEPTYKSGAVVDGFPRTKVQVECVKLLYNKLIALRNKYAGTPHEDYFKKPHYHIVVLFVDQQESVRRQLYRGEQARIHNEKVRESGVGKLIEVRPTDIDPNAAANRYRTFKEQTYDALKELREIFFYHFINAHGTIEEVRERIDKELRYQGSLELDEATHDDISCIPIASSLATHARQDLVDRLDSYEQHHKELFKEVIETINQEFMPIIVRHAISGMAMVNTENVIFNNPDALAMLIDIFSERGYHATIDIRREEIPESFDPKTFEIKVRVKRVYRVSIQFQGSEIRRGR